MCVSLSVKGHTEEPSGETLCLSSQECRRLSKEASVAADDWPDFVCSLLQPARHVSLPLSVCEPSDGLKRTAVMAACPSVSPLGQNSSSTGNLINYAAFKSHGTECSDGKIVSIPICTLN